MALNGLSPCPSLPISSHMKTYEIPHILMQDFPLGCDIKASGDHESRTALISGKHYLATNWPMKSSYIYSNKNFLMWLYIIPFLTLNVFLGTQNIFKS